MPLLELEAPHKSAQNEEKTVGLVSLGCSKNLVDSEVMLGLLQGAGYRITGDVDEADAIIVNTCGFLGAAVEESLQTLNDMAGAQRIRAAVAPSWRPVVCRNATRRSSKTARLAWMRFWAARILAPSSARLIPRLKPRSKGAFSST